MGGTPGALANVAQRFEADRLKYPGLLPEETIVLRAWLALHQTEYDRFDYNVRVGPGDDPGPKFSAAIRADGIALTQLRMDAVGWKGIGNAQLPALITSPSQVYDVVPGAQATIIEVKRRGTSTNIGQLTTYYHAWITEFPRPAAPRLILACTLYSPSILPAIRNLNIELDVVQADFSSLKVPAHVKTPKL
jgi:hypothetical protein